MFRGRTEHVATREAALFHGCAGQRGKTDDVAGGVNVRDTGLIVFVDLDLAARIGFHAGRCEVKAIAVRLTAYGVDERVALYFLSAFEFRKNAASRGIDSHPGHFFTEAESSAHLAEVISQSFHDFSVDEIQNRGTLVYQSDFGSQGCEKRGVFKADNSRANHNNFPGQSCQAGKTVGIDDAFVIERNLRISSRPRAAGD